MMEQTTGTARGDADDKATLQAQFDQYMLEGASAKNTAGKKVANLFNPGQDKTAVAFSKCSGGTQQIHNRLGQSAVRNAYELVIFAIREGDSLSGMETYISGAFRGEKEPVPAPQCPVAIAQPTDGVWTIKTVIGSVLTDAARLARDTFDAKHFDPYAHIPVELPEDVNCYRLVLDDVHGRRLPVSVSVAPDEAANLAKGDVVILCSPRDEDERGSPVGLAVVGNIRDQDQKCLIVFHRLGSARAGGLS